jgi:hypothetical protein
MRGLELCRAMLVSGVLLAVVGCDTTVQETLGLGRRSPDEFQVVRRAPLVIPPDATLRPPGSVTEASRRNDPADDARSLLTGERSEPFARGTASGGERALVEASKVDAAPDIRSRLVAENVELAQLDRRTFLWILNFQREQFRAEDEVLNPGAEAARLRGGRTTSPVTVVRTGSAPLPPS